MSRTFSFRRQDLLDQLTLRDLLSLYPPLQDPEEVRKYCKIFDYVIVPFCFCFSLLMSLTE